MTQITLTHHQIKLLLGLSESGDDETMVVAIGGENFHSGPGVYAYFNECPEEGVVYLPEGEEQERESGDE